MTLDLDSFIRSLAWDLAGRASLSMLIAPRKLFYYRGVEADAFDPYSVLTPYPGPAAVADGLPRMALQVRTLAKATATDAAALAACNALYLALCEDSGRPARMRTITARTSGGIVETPAWKLVSVEFRQRPGLVSRDENGRATYAFNVDLGFYRVPA